MRYYHLTLMDLDDWTVYWVEVFSETGVLLESVAEKAWRTWETGDNLINLRYIAG